jgi:drug/metabolite transporter (DMT)-like permease
MTGDHGNGESTPAASRSRRTRTAMTAVAATVVVWSVSNVAIKTVSVPGLVASFYRLWFAIAVLWTVALLVPRVRRRFDRTWLRASVVGGALFGVHQLFFFTSVMATSIANVMIIAAVQPALVALVAGKLFGERVTAGDVVWAIVALGGTAAVMVGSAGTPAWSLLGDGLAVLNLLSFTAYFLASKRLRSQVGPVEYMVGMSTVAGVIVTAVTLLSGQDIRSPDGYDLVVLALVALIPGTTGHLVVNWAHAHTEAFVVSIMILAIPVFSSAGAALFLDEPLNFTQVAGGVVVLVAVAMVVRAGRYR